MVSITFVSLKSYSAFFNSNLRSGGAEKQVSLLCGYLKKYFRTNVILEYSGFTDVKFVKGINFFPLTGKFLSKLWRPFLVFILYPLNLFLSVRATNSDIYILGGHARINTVMGFVWLKILSKKVIIRISGDDEAILGSNRWNMNPLTNFLYKNAIFKSSIIVQNTSQENRLRAYGKNSERISNATNLYPFNEDIRSRRTGHISNRKIVLWVGKFTDAKNPEDFVNLSAKFPNIKFIMVGGVVDSNLYKSLKEKIKELPNLYYLGYINSRKTKFFYRNSIALVNTSKSEGFSNTFLEAWNHGVPIISYTDPDKLMTKKNLGYFCTNVDDLSTSLSEIISNDNLRLKMSVSAYKYIAENHSVNLIGRKYRDYVNRILQH